MSIQLIRLDQELRSVLPEITGLTPIWTGPQDNPKSSYLLKDGNVVRVCWTIEPSPSQISQADAIITAHDGTLTEGEKLDRLLWPNKLLGAISLRLSDNWTTPPPAGATGAEKTRAMAIINDAGQKVLNKIRS